MKVILIGGSSHAGKSTVAESLAAKLGWSYLSTDRLAAHPGLPLRRPEPVSVQTTCKTHSMHGTVIPAKAGIRRGGECSPHQL